MKQKPLIIVILVVLSFSVSGRTLAAQKHMFPNQAKFAAVNFQKIFRESSAARSIRPQILKHKKLFENKFKELQKQLKAREKDLQRQRAILSSEAYVQKQKQFKDEVSSVQREVQTVQRMVRRAESNAYKHIRREFHRIAQEIAKEKSLQVIFPRSGLIFVAPKFDISDEILRMLDKRLPRITVNLPPVQGRKHKYSLPKQDN